MSEFSLTYLMCYYISGVVELYSYDASELSILFTVQLLQLIRSLKTGLFL